MGDHDIARHNLELATIRGNLIDLVGVTVQIYSVLAVMRPYGNDDKSKAIDKEMTALMERIQKTLASIKVPS